MECQARSNGRIRIRWNQWKENQWFRPNDQSFCILETIHYLRFWFIQETKNDS